MTDLTKIDYSALDQPEVLAYLFHPRPDSDVFSSSGPGTAIRIPVADGISIGARFHVGGKSWPTILFFHGNGEIVSDYDDMASLYQQANINFLPVDYRGYGSSDGSPTVTSMLQDAHVIFAFVRDWMEREGITGRLAVMGRSLGSASALEVAASYPDQIGGLIIESGFAFAVPLLRLIGIDVDRLGIRETDGMGNLDKMKQIQNPTRIIHAEFDHIIPFSDGAALYEACPVKDKELIRIPGADHNTIFYYGMETYMRTLHSFLHGNDQP